MSPQQAFLARMAVRASQLCCLLLMLTGFAFVPELQEAAEAAVKGAISAPQLCWKILPVTGLLLPAFCALVGAELILRGIKPCTHDPHEPWMADPMWAARHIRLNNRGLFWGIAACLLVYLGIVVPFAIGTEKTPFLVLAGVIGVFLLLIANVSWRNRKWNTAELRLASVPGVIGGPFAGVAILQQTFPPGEAFEICLKCQQTKIYRATRGSPRTSSLTETVWSSTITIDKPLPQESPHRSLVPFGFAIPFECEPTSAGHGVATTTKWSLVVNQKGVVGFGGAVFPVPIYRTPESRRDYTLHRDLITPYEQMVDLRSLLARVRMAREPLTGGGQRLTFGIWNGETASAMSLLSLGCAGAIAACFWLIADPLGAVFAAAFPGLFLLAGVYMLLDMWLWSGSLEISGDALRCESGWRGFRKAIQVNRLHEYDVVSEFATRRQNGEWYRVALHVPSTEQESTANDAARLVLARQLDGRAEADALAQWLRQEIAGTEVSASSHLNSRPDL